MQKACKLIDAHCHLTEPQLAGQLDLILADSKLAGVEYLVCNATKPSQWQSCLHAATLHKQIIPCIGIHPWFVDCASKNWQSEMIDSLNTSKAAIGEIGLDCWKNPDQIDLQISIFKDQLAIACQLDLPVSVHCLKAWNHMQKVLREVKNLPRRIHFHAFNAPENLIPELLSYDFYFSIAPDILRNYHEKQIEKIKLIPRDRIMIETDSPDMKLANIEMLNQKHHLNFATSNRKYNSPANLKLLALELADKLNMSFENLAETTTTNAKRFWKEFI